MCLPSFYLMYLDVTKFPKPYFSIFSKFEAGKAWEQGLLGLVVLPLLYSPANIDICRLSKEIDPIFKWC